MVNLIRSSVKACPVAENTDLIKKRVCATFLFNNVTQMSIKTVWCSNHCRCFVTSQPSYDVDSYRYYLQSHWSIITIAKQLKWLHQTLHWDHDFSRNLQLFPDLNLQDFTISFFRVTNLIKIPTEVLTIN